MVNPLPKKMSSDFAAKVDQLYVVEELDPVIEEQVRAWGIKAQGKELLTVQGEYSAVPLARGPKASKQFEDDSAVCFCPFPGVLQEMFAS